MRYNFDPTNNLPPDFNNHGRIQPISILARPKMEMTPKQKTELNAKLSGLQKSVDKFLAWESENIKNKAC
jgi:hypothetical protein